MSKNNTVYIGENRKFWDRNRRSGGYLLKKRSGQIALSIVRGLLLFGLCFMIIQPLLTRFGIGLMEEQDLYDSQVILLPRNVTLDNYRIVAELTDLKVKGGDWTFRALGNTLWVSLLVSVCQIVACTLVAYGFARYEFKGKKFWFACVVALIIIPPQTIQSSLYTNFARFDLLRVFTLFGVNAEGKDFGQRVLSLFDGTGTGIFSLFLPTDKGLTLGDRINVINLYRSGVIDDRLLGLLKSGQLTTSQLQQLVNLYNAGITNEQLQQLCNLGVTSSQLKQLANLFNTGISAEQIKQMISLYDSGVLNQELLDLIGSGTLTAEQLANVNNLGFSGEQIKLFCSLYQSTITSDRMQQMVALIESGVMNSRTIDMFASGSTTIFSQIGALENLYKAGVTAGNVLTLVQSGDLSMSQLKELSALSASGLTSDQIRQFYTMYSAGIRDGQLEKASTLFTSGQLQQLVEIYKANPAVGYPLTLVRNFMDSGLVSQQLMDHITSGKLPIAHLAALEGNVPGTDFLFSGVPLNLRSSIAAYTVMALTCMGLKNGLYIYMMRQYFQGIPTSLEEAAYVDGCGTMHTFVKIMLPDALPTIASCFLFSFVWQWTDIFYTRLFLPSTTISMYSAQMSSMVSRMGRYFSADSANAVVVSNGRQQQLLAIAVLICSVPLIILYLFTQRTFVESLASSGSKE